MSLIDRLADNAHRKDNDDQVAKAYDSGIGLCRMANRGYSETVFYGKLY